MGCSFLDIVLVVGGDLGLMRLGVVSVMHATSCIMRHGSTSFIYIIFSFDSQFYLHM